MTAAIAGVPSAISAIVFPPPSAGTVLSQGSNFVTGSSGSAVAAAAIQTPAGQGAGGSERGGGGRNGAARRVQEWIDAHGRDALSAAALASISPRDLAEAGVDDLDKALGWEKAQMIMNAVVPEGVTQDGDAAAVRVWAPILSGLELMLRRRDGGEDVLVLRRDRHGNYLGVAGGMGAGAEYMFRIRNRDGGLMWTPDPHSRFQPGGVSGWSRVVNAGLFDWGDAHHVHRDAMDMAIYELHVGTFTSGGTYHSMTEGAGWDYLMRLRDMGINTIELMPVNAFAGKYNWGYDGVLPLAVQNSYGTPDELRGLVKKLHEADFSVIFDLVLNHLGPEGANIHLFADRISPVSSPWGWQLDFAGRDANGKRDGWRDFAVRQNRDLAARVVRMYIDEYGADGLRFDMSAYIGDPGKRAWPENREMLRLIRDAASAAHRRTVVIAEDGREYDEGRSLFERIPIEHVWMFDYQQVISSVLGRRNYFPGICLGAESVIEIMKYGMRLLTGVSRDGVPPGVLYFSSHDEVGNYGGERHANAMPPDKYRMAAAITLVSRGMPMIFMGDEGRSQIPFRFFRDLGRANELGQAEKICRECAMISGSGGYRPDEGMMALVKDLLRLRSESAALRSKDAGATRTLVSRDRDGAFVLLRGAGDDGVLIAVNLSGTHFGESGRNFDTWIPDGVWDAVINTQDPRYGGQHGLCWMREAHGGHRHIELPPRSVVILRKRR